MSFDVFLVRFRDGKEAEADRLPVREVLSAATYRGPSEHGFYDVAFPDGVHVEFFADKLESQKTFSSCSFEIRRFSKSLMKFMLDIARAGDMVMFPAMKGNPLILVSEEQRKSVPADLLASFPPVVVSSGEELGAVLEGGFDGWAAYRDYVLEKTKREGNESTST